MSNSADPGQLASEEANWSGYTLFAETGHDVFSKRRDKRSQTEQCPQSNFIRVWNAGAIKLQTKLPRTGNIYWQGTIEQCQEIQIKICKRVTAFERSTEK